MEVLSCEKPAVEWYSKLVLDEGQRWVRNKSLVGCEMGHGCWGSMHGNRDIGGELDDALLCTTGGLAHLPRVMWQVGLGGQRWAGDRSHVR